MKTGSLAPSRLQPTMPAFASKRGALRLAVIALAYFFAHQVAFLFPDAGKVLAAVWPAAGIGLAALLFSPRRLWPAILVALFIAGNTANLLDGRPIANSLGFMTANVLESLACAALIRRWCGEQITFTRIKEIAALVCAATGVNAATALVGAGTAALTTGAAFWSFWGTWWVADGLGLFLVTPLIVAWSSFRVTNLRGRGREALEAGFFLGLWGLATWGTFRPAGAGQAFMLQPYMLVALLTWPALRLGQRAVTLALTVLVVIAVTSPAVSAGPLLWGGSDTVARLLLVQVYVACTALTGYLLTASYAETRAAERTSREDQARLRALGDNLPGGAIYQVVRESDGKQRFVYLTAGIERLTGVTAEIALQNPQALYDLFAEEDRPSVAAAETASARDLTVFSAILRQRRLDGQERWMQLTSAPRRLADGRTLWDGIQQDITERKQAERQVQEQNELLQAQNEELAAQRGELQAQNEELRARQDELQQTEAALRVAARYSRNLIETSLDPLVTISTEGKIMDVNTATEKLTGLSRERLIGSDFADYFTEPEVARAGYQQAFGQGQVIDYPLTMRHTSGALTEVLYNASVYRNEQGEVLGVFTAARDITARKQAEDAVRQLNVELEQRVAVRTAELSARTAQLEAVNKELEAFSYSVSHDLRAPLRGIDGWSQALLEDYGPHLDAQGKTYLDRVRAETQRMGHLIDALLQLSRLTRAELRPKRVNLSALAQTIAAHLQEAAPERRVVFAIQPGLNIKGDAQLLEIALTNLLDNAFKFTGKTPLARIEFGQTEVEGKRAFFVRDNGAGFNMALAKQLFGAFQRLHRASAFPGTGIGLTTVQRVIHRHGGRIWAEAAVGQGATFYFTLEEGL